jgi:sugar lactone lactonase YvrE
LRRLEHEFADVLTVIGVHAGKYPNERITAQIRFATHRLGVTHPVVNDRQFRFWRRYGVQAWPTLVFVGPTGEYLGSHAGEASYEGLVNAMGELVASAERGGALRRVLGPAADSGVRPAPAPAEGLAFPTKLVAGGAGRLFVADTGHDRVLEVRLDPAMAAGTIETVIGSGAPALRDGSFAEACFTRPHGLAFDGHTLFIADTGNHAVRAADLETRTVRTLAGTGERAQVAPWTPVPGRTTPLASPWDLALVGPSLYVAMAGLHQLWVLDVVEETVRAFAGSGSEHVFDGVLRAATLAQPSALAAVGDRLYFADAESSAVRWADLATPFGERAVHTVVGTGLFDFGDRDGVGDEVRLQHVAGLAPWGGGLVLADTYNHRLKLVDPASRRVRTWTSAEECGGLNEPEGVAVVDGRVVVADTNQHRLVVVEPGADGTPECRALAFTGR